MRQLSQNDDKLNAQTNPSLFLGGVSIHDGLLMLLIKGSFSARKSHAGGRARGFSPRSRQRIDLNY